MDKSIIESRHALYKDLAASWELWRAAYYGGREYVNKALVSHRLENKTGSDGQPSDFANRQRRATLLNYLRPICDTYANYLFRPEWGIEGPATVKPFLTDCDRRGSSLQDFFKSILPLAASLGFIPLGVDTPNPGELDVEPRTQADRQALGIRPYVYMVDPTNFLDWEEDEDGGLKWALIREETTKKTVDAGKVSDKGGESYLLYFPDRWIRMDEDGNVVKNGEGENKTGRVPFVPLKFRDGGDAIIGSGLGQDLEPVQAHILNVGSLLSEILYRQTFSQMVAEGSAEEYTSNGSLAVLGTSSIFLYPEGRTAPSFIGPNTGQAALLQIEMDRSIDEIYRLANLKRGSAKEATEQSGISKAFDFLDTNQAVADTGRNVADAMTKVINLAARWEGDDNPAAVVTPPADYGIVDLDGDVARYAMLVDKGAPRALIDRLANRIGSTLFPGDKSLETDLKAEAGGPNAITANPPRTVDPSRIFEA